jgi:hypothetical protein
MMVAIHKREAFGSVIQAQYSDEITTMAVPQTLGPILNKYLLV